MPSDAPQDSLLTRAGLLRAAARLGWPAATRHAALRIAGWRAEAATWRRLVDRFLLGAGAALLLSGIGFFFAYNWAALHRFAKLGLVEAALLGAAAAAAYGGLHRRAGQVALTAACALVGVVLGVYGQVYQTGAEAYGLFVTWALLVTPWVVVGRFVPLSLLYLALWHVALLFTWQQRWDPAMDAGTLLWMGLAVLDAFVLAAWEVLARRGTVGPGRIGPRLVAVTALLFATGPVIGLIDQGAMLVEAEPWSAAAPVLYVVGIGLAGWVYRRAPVDLVILAAIAASLIAVTTTLLFEGLGTGAWATLAIGGLVLVQAWGAVVVLRGVARRAGGWR